MTRGPYLDLPSAPDPDEMSFSPSVHVEAPVQAVVRERSYQRKPKFLQKPRYGLLHPAIPSTIVKRIASGYTSTVRSKARVEGELESCRTS